MKEFVKSIFCLVLFCSNAPTLLSASDGIVSPNNGQSNNRSELIDTTQSKNSAIRGPYSCLNLRDHKSGKFIWDISKIRFLFLDDSNLLVAPTADGSYGSILATGIWTDGNKRTTYRVVNADTNNDTIYIDVISQHGPDIELKFTSNDMSMNGIMNCTKIPEIMNIPIDQVFEKIFSQQ